tara:strand:+ start:286 stop:579 length:294 start_codon:yes stop_codon:yes gene_type:complete
MNQKRVINFVKVSYIEGADEDGNLDETRSYTTIEGFDQTNFRSISPTFSRAFSNPMSALICLEKIQVTNKNLGLPLLIVEFNGFPDKFPEQKTLTDF